MSAGTVGNGPFPPSPRGAHKVYKSVKYRAKYEKVTTREVEITRGREYICQESS